MKTVKAPLAVAAFVAALSFLASPSRARAQIGDPTKVTLKTTPVAGGVSLIEGANGFSGGNVGAFVGDDGVLVIDDALEPIAPKLRTALAALSKKPVRFVVNTHLHMDHTGSNAALGGGGAVIVAHYNVRKRLSADQFIEMAGQKKTIPASPAAALPVVTFNDDLTFFFNGDELHVVHVPPAHTDGDAIIHFKKANVIHMGDTFVGGYPFADKGSGGAFGGFVAAAERALTLADDRTKIIPGHGPVMTKADLVAWRDMLVTLRDRVAAMKAKKKTLDEVKAAKPTAEFDAAHSQGFIKPDMLVEMIYDDASTEPAATKPTTKKKR
jgi:glyoxylase-like metal-dependent hydrolase (beta-lactamase superfamily II)